MLKGLAMVVALGACGSTPNPLYCDEDTDCRNGTVCNLDTHGCEPAIVLDAEVDDGPEPDDDRYVARTVQEVRALTTPVDTPVELTEVVVTAVDRYGQRTGEFWVQELGGGPASGIHVFGALDADFDLLNVGDTIDIRTARKVTFTVGGDTTGRTDIQIQPRIGETLSITKTGTGLPITSDMDVDAIATLPQPQLDQELEKWGGMLVRLTYVRADGPLDIGFSVTQFTIGPVYVQDTQTELPPKIVSGTCFPEIIGIVEYVRHYNIVPRQPSDITVGAGCP